MPRLPNPRSDAGQWGDLLNEFLRVGHNDDGSLKNVKEVFNVKDFGAKGDGVTDDTLAIQRAIDSAFHVGGIVVIPPGIFNLTSSLQLKSNVTLKGGGVNSSIIKQTVSGQDGIQGNGVSWVTIEDLCVQDVFNVGSSESRGIYFFGGSSDCFLNRVRANNCDDACIRIGSITSVESRFKLTDCVTTSSPEGHGLELLRCEDIDIIGHRSSNNFNHGIRLAGCQKVIVSSSRVFSNLNGISVQGSGTDGINIIKRASNIQIIGCYSRSNTQAGVELFNEAENVSISSCIFEGEVAGVEGQGSGALERLFDLRNSSIVDCRFISCITGLFLFSSVDGFTSNCKISDNYFSDFISRGISLAKCNDIDVRENYILSSQGGTASCLRLYDGTRNCHIEDNTFSLVNGISFETVGIGLGNVIITKPQDFGAKGDGVTDNYIALKNMVAAINTFGNGNIVFPPGVYKINQHVSSSNGITHLQFLNCRGLNISGYGAKLDFKGGFNRTVAAAEESVHLMFTFCKQVKVCGLEFDGNVELTTRDISVTDGNGHGLEFEACEDVTVQDVFCHHWMTDGFHISEDTGSFPRKACKNITMNSCRAENCARQGISVIQCRGLTATSCRFTNAGNSGGGTYGVVNPGLGIDVEPNRSGSSNIDVDTGEIVFINCHIENCNRLISNASSNLKGHVSFYGCTAKGPTGVNIQAVILGSAQDSIWDGGEIDVADKRMYVSWNVTNNGNQRTVIKNAKILGSSRILFGGEIGDASGVIITGCNIISNSTSPDSNYIILFRDCNQGEFTNNLIFVPKERYSSISGEDVVINLSRIKNCTGNSFTTDLSTTGKFFSTSYAGTKIVHNEYYNNEFFRMRENAGAQLWAKPASGTILGNVSKKVEVFDEKGNSIGFLPIYDSIS